MTTKMPGSIYDSVQSDRVNNTTSVPQQKSTGTLNTFFNMLNRMRKGDDQAMAPFAGRLGANQTFVLDREDPDNASLLDRVPDAAPNLGFHEAFDMRGFREPVLYKAAIIELIGEPRCVYLTISCPLIARVGSMLLNFTGTWSATSPPGPPPPPHPYGGVFLTPPFLGAVAAAVQMGLLLSILVYGFGSVSGAHFNPLVTIATFFARLTTFPRMVLYVSAQIAGAILAGQLIRAGQGTSNFKVGGCFKLDNVTTNNALTVEIMSSLFALFLAFGIGLDPRQRQIFGPALAPALVGVAIGGLTLSYAYGLPGYGGPSLNPARCLGVYVVIGFPGYHWVHWVGMLTASMFHGLIYFVIPPESFEGSKNVDQVHMKYRVQESTGRAENKTRDDGSNV
jgi:glycerol uptake facilitator-like aquaporin